jgi:hypothetical protein
MTWVWEWAQDDFWAEFDGERSTPALGYEVWSAVPIESGKFNLVYSSTHSIKRFRSRHCPPMGSEPCVDKVWQDIILKFVSKERIQFYPVTLLAKGGESRDYSLVIPFDRVNCIDERKSEFTSIVEKPDMTLYFGLNKVVHRHNCMGNSHLARDTIIKSHLLVSDALKEALSATGESSMFFRPEQLPLV